MRDRAAARPTPSGTPPRAASAVCLRGVPGGLRRTTPPSPRETPKSVPSRSRDLRALPRARFLRVVPARASGQITWPPARPARPEGLTRLLLQDRPVHRGSPVPSPRLVRGPPQCACVFGCAPRPVPVDPSSAILVHIFWRRGRPHTRARAGDPVHRTTTTAAGRHDAAAVVGGTFRKASRGVFVCVVTQ